MLAHNNQAGGAKVQGRRHTSFAPPPPPIQQHSRHSEQHGGFEHRPQRNHPERAHHQDQQNTALFGNPLHHQQLRDRLHSRPSLPNMPFSMCFKSRDPTGSSTMKATSNTIHPTIANMVSFPLSPCSAPPSPPEASSYGSFPPAPSSSSSFSLCSPRNISKSPEMESNLQQEDQPHPLHYYQNQQRLATERRPVPQSSPLPLPPTTLRYRDEIMMDTTQDNHPNAQPLSSSPTADSRMDQHESQPPQQERRAWSWSSGSSSPSSSSLLSIAQQSNASSPPIVPLCTKSVHPLQSASYHCNYQKDSEPQHSNHQQQQQHDGQNLYRDQSAYNYQQYSQRWPERQQHRVRHTNHTTSRETTTVATGLICRQRTPRVYPPRKPTRPLSFPDGHSIALVVTKTTPSQRSSCPALSLPSPEKGSLTPPLPLQDRGDHTGSHGHLQHGSFPRTDRDQRRHSLVLPLPKNYEQMSVAQKMLYERHPPSPKNDRTLSLSTPTLSSSSSQPSSPSSPSSISDGSCTPTSSPDRSGAATTSSLAGAMMRAEHSREPYPEKLPPLLLPTYDCIPERKNSQQQPQQHPTKLGMVLQDPPPRLPSLSSFAFPRGQLRTHNRSGSSARSSISSAVSPSAVTKFSSLTLSSAPHVNAVKISTGIDKSSRMVARTAGQRTKSSTSTSSVNNSSITEAAGMMTVVKNEDGAIMVYNPITESMSFRCELCPGESFGRIHDLKRHQTSKHQEMTWPCDFCHRPFVRRDALLRHYTVKAARDDGLHPASHEVEKLLAARARAKMLY